MILEQKCGINRPTFRCGYLYTLQTQEYLQGHLSFFQRHTGSIAQTHHRFATIYGIIKPESLGILYSDRTGKRIA